MITLPIAFDLARNATAAGLVGSRPTDPVIAEADTPPRPSRAPRTRTRLSTLLHRAADAVAPAEYSPAR